MNYRHLTQVETRLQKLEALFSRLLPNTDIEEAISSLPSPQLPTQISDSRPVEAATVKAKPEIVHEDEMSEALPQEADGFEWKEEASDVNHTSDGMAALSVEPSGIGYLGMYQRRKNLIPDNTESLS